MLDAGSVTTTLRGQFSPGAFKEFDAANRQAAATAAESEAKITASQGRLASVLGRTAKAQDDSAAAAKRAALAQSQQSVAVARNEAETAKLEKAIRSSGVATKLQAAELDHLTKQHGLLSGAMDQTAAKTSLWDRYNGQASKNLSTLGNVAAKGAAIGILALGAATIYAATKATTFNREMLKISTQAGGTTAEVKGLSSEILKLAGTVPQGPQKLAEGLYHIESAGFRGAQAMSMLKASAMGAALGNADLQNTTQAMIAATASQIKGVHGAADAMGQLNAIVGVGDMRMEGLAQAMATGLLPSAANAGLSLRDVGAALATVTDNATPANVTATRLRMTIALMASPSKAAAKELETIGMSSTQMAHDLRQPNGLLKAVEDLKTHLKDSGLTAEQQFGVLSKVFGGGRSSAVIQTLIAETDRLKTKYKELEAINGPTRLAKSWSEFQASNAATFSELKSGAEAFAITVGDVVLPSLAKLAHEGASAMSGFVSSGGAARAGSDISHVFETLGQVVGSVVPVVVSLAHALIEVGSAVGLGNAGEITALLGGFIAFRAATFVAPILLSIAGAISTVGVAVATAPSLGAFAADLASMVGPAGILAAGLVALGGAFVLFGSSFGNSTSAAELNATAMRKDTEAITQLHDATAKASEAHIAAERSALAHKKAVEQLARVEKEVHDGKLKGTAGGDATLEARLGVAETANQHTAAIKQETAAMEKRASVAQNSISSAQAVQLSAEKELQTFQQIMAVHPAATREEQILQAEKLAELQENYNRAAAKTAQITAELQVKQESLNRLNAGQDAISGGNAQGVAQLQNALASAHAPSKIVTKYELDDQGAQAQLGSLAQRLSALGHQQVVAKVLTTAPSAAVAIEAFKAVLAGVPSAKVISILHNAPSAGAAMHALAGAINAVPSSKGVTIATNAAAARGEIQSIQGAIDGLSGRSIAVAVTQTFSAVEGIVKKATGHASGRPGGTAEASLVGEGSGPEYIINRTSGQGIMVNQPTVMGLSPDDYVIPLEDRYRGRALGLFAMLARDLEVPGYAAGKAPVHAAHPGKPHKRPPRYIPPHLDALSLPVEEIQTSADHAKSVYDKAHSAVKSLDGQIANAERTLQFASPKGNARAKARAALSALTSKRQTALAAERKDAQEMHYAEKTLKYAKDYQAKITKETDLANIAGNDMRLADGRNDQAGYDSAKQRRLDALGVLKGLIATAQKHVKVDSSYSRQLEQQVQTAAIEAQTTEGEAFANPAAEREASTGMTDAEQARLKQIEANVALAALTPGLADDKTAAGQLVGFLETVLGEVQAEPTARGGDSSIVSVANMLKTARSNLESLSGTGTNENADLQAQITQANERTAQATRSAQIAEQALQVFSGSGDIGAGGQNASAAVIQNIYTLHPGDPATQLAVGNAAVAGIGLQGSRRAVRQQVGP